MGKIKMLKLLNTKTEHTGNIIILKNHGSYTYQQLEH